MKDEISIKSFIKTFFKVIAIIIVTSIVSIIFLFYSQDWFSSEMTVCIIEILLFCVLQFFLSFFMRFSSKLELVIVLLLTSIPMCLFSIFNLAVSSDNSIIIGWLTFIYPAQCYFGNALASDFIGYDNNILIIIVSALITAFSQGLIYLGYFFWKKGINKYHNRGCLN